MVEALEQVLQKPLLEAIMPRIGVDKQTGIQVAMKC
jgi:hypothetical protein